MRLDVTSALNKWQFRTIMTALSIADGPARREAEDACRIGEAMVGKVNQAVADSLGVTLHPENPKEVTRAIYRATFLECARMMDEDWVAA